MFRSDVVDVRKLETLIEINTLINSDYSDARALLTRIIESATKLTEGEASSLLLLNPENQRLYFEIALGSKGPDVQKYSLRLGEGIAGWVAENNRSLVVNDVEDDPRFYADISKSVGFPTSSILAVPMRMKNACIGVIEMINKKNGKRFDDDDRQWLEIFANQAALAIQNARSFQKVRDELDVLQDSLTVSQGYHTFVGSSTAIQEQLSVADRIARTDSSVLILGESGVGKELFAEQIHLRSGRRDQPLIRVNCAALPGNLLESELFGHVKGAFTDASSDRRGRFELADGGTIFLDEVAELPLELQAKMLRVIQHRTFQKVGASEPMTVDVRIVAATNREIEREVEEGRFRRDLYYRLNVLPLHIPALRHRTEDIPELAEFFLKRFSREMKKTVDGFTSEAMETLLTYSWPGNVRELENAVERAVVISMESYLRSEDLVLRQAGDRDRYEGKTLKESTSLFKKHFIESTLRTNEWNQTAAAKQLGIQRTYLSRLIKELGISR